MKKLNTFDEEETLNTTDYTKVYLDGKTYLVNFNDRDSVEKFVKFLNNTRGNVYDIYEEADGNLAVFRVDQFEVETMFFATYLQYIGETSTPEQPINYRDMSYMFYHCENLESLDLSTWNTSKVINMYGMFARCKNLESLDLSKWDTSKITDMSCMFAGCKNLESLNLSKWDTSKVTDMCDMFAGCKNLESLDLSNWDTSKVTDMSCIFDSTSIKDKYPDLSEREIIKELGGK